MVKHVACQSFIIGCLCLSFRYLAVESMRRDVWIRILELQIFVLCRLQLSQRQFARLKSVPSACVSQTWLLDGCYRRNLDSSCPDAGSVSKDTNWYVQNLVRTSARFHPVVAQALIRYDPEVVAARPSTCILDLAGLILDHDGRPNSGKS